MDALKRLEKAQQGREWAEAEWQDAVAEARSAGISHQKIFEIEGITDPEAMLEKLQERQRDG